MILVFYLFFGVTFLIYTDPIDDIYDSNMIPLFLIVMIFI